MSLIEEYNLPIDQIDLCVQVLSVKPCVVS
jgi:hypothetical protein